MRDPRVQAATPACRRCGVTVYVQPDGYCGRCGVQAATEQARREVVR